MNKTKTLYEKLDVISNLVEQMFLSHSVNDESQFIKAHEHASFLCFDAARQMEKMDLDNK